MRRPPLRYYGGKWRLAPWIISHFPPHSVYVDPFGGGASVLLRKPRSYVEVYNDLDCDIVNLFRVLRDDELAARLVRLVRLTPYSRVEFELSYQPAEDPVERARRLLFRSAAGRGATAASGPWRTGFRTSFRRSGSTSAHDWAGMPDVIEDVAERMRGVIVEHGDALDVMQRYDGADTLYYVDPPYPVSVRGHNANGGYRHDMDDGDHERLAEVLHQLDGYVVLSGYDCPMYRDLYADWQMVTADTWADGARRRVEVLWLSPNSVIQPELFQEVR